ATVSACRQLSWTTTKLPGVGPEDWLVTPLLVVPTYDDWPVRISITTSPPPCSRMSPVITAAGQTALVSVKYSVPPPQTGPAPAPRAGRAGSAPRAGGRPAREAGGAGGPGCGRRGRGRERVGWGSPRSPRPAL